MSNPDNEMETSDTSLDAQRAAGGSPVNDLEIYERTDGKFDFRITAAENGNILASSDQGYNDEEEAHKIGRRVLSSVVGDITFTQIVG
jgi:uncharacterized protein YegP (UPF0339 family)